MIVKDLRLSCEPCLGSYEHPTIDGAHKRSHELNEGKTRKGRARYLVGYMYRTGEGTDLMLDE